MSTVHRLEESLALVFLVIATSMVFLSGISRFLGQPLGWSIDLATFCFAWAVFLGADVAFRQDRHVSVEIFVQRLSKPWQRAIKLFNLCLVALFLLALLVYGSEMAYATRFRTFQGIPELSYAWVTLSVPVGSLLLLTTTVGKIRQLLKENPA